MKNDTAPTYDESAVFNSEVYPLLEKAHAICDKHGISMVAYCQYGQCEDPDDASHTRASMAALVNIEGNKACPLIHAVALVAKSPEKASLAMIAATMGCHGIVEQEEDNKRRAASKDAVDALLSTLGQTNPDNTGHA